MIRTYETIIHFLWSNPTNHICSKPNRAEMASGEIDNERMKQVKSISLPPHQFCFVVKSFTRVGNGNCNTHAAFRKILKPNSVDYKQGYRGLDACKEKKSRASVSMSMISSIYLSKRSAITSTLVHQAPFCIAVLLD